VRVIVVVVMRKAVTVSVSLSSSASHLNLKEVRGEWEWNGMERRRWKLVTAPVSGMEWVRVRGTGGKQQQGVRRK
jgi:hypothetical protein